MKRPRRLLLAGVVAIGSLMPFVFMGCGGDDSVKNDGGGDDATIDNGLGGDVDNGDGSEASCAPFCNDGGCVTPGSACKSNLECCSGTCLANGTCGIGS